MARERVLVTGGTGITGSRLVERLITMGHSVRVVTRNLAQHSDSLPDTVELVEGDLSDPSVAPRAVRGCDVVYHLAALFREAGVPDSRYREVHVDATRYLLEASRDARVRRFVHCSTVGVHSHIEDPPADEDCPHRPADVYQATKSEGEQLALEFGREHDLPLTVARPAPIYGAGDPRLSKLFRAIAHRRFAMIGSGEPYFHMVHLDDLVEGLLLAANRDEAVGEVFIFAGPEYCTLNELAERIAGIFDVPAPKMHLPVWPFYAAGAVCEKICVPLRIQPPIFRRRVAFFTNSRAFRIDKARRMLGYEPKVGLQQGLEDTASWYQREGYV